MPFILRIVVAFSLFSFQTALAQQTTWEPNFVLLDVKALTAGLGYLPNYLGQNVREKMDDCRAESAMFHFRVNSQGKVDSIRIEGNLRPDYQQTIVDNIRSTEGKWQLPSNTKPGDECWFIYPFFLFGYTYDCPKETAELYKTQQANYTVFSRLKLPTQTQYGILLSLRVPRTMSSR
ncbi:hypothetical protein ACFQ4C_07155 [Larkinella insperata]|uniref:TonB C-terminal domain-containing protein n=1 Tax=Larkinella insperata TaxID=332158 RepID=A0ABW3QG78_9BACT